MKGWRFFSVDAVLSLNGSVGDLASLAPGAGVDCGFVLLSRDYSVYMFLEEGNKMKKGRVKNHPVSMRLLNLGIVTCYYCFGVPLLHM